MQKQYKNNYSKILEFNGKIFVYDIRNMILAEIDEVTKEVIDAIANKEDIMKLHKEYGEEINESYTMISELIENGLFFSDEEIPSTIEGYKYSEGLLSLPTIHQCNLRCKYCFADYGENFKGENRKFPIDLVEKALRYIYFEYMPECTKYRLDFVSGGEPLLNLEVIKEVSRVGKLLYEETGKKLMLWLCTNGTQFTEENLEFLNKHHVNIGISIDGPEEEHDRNRKDAKGNGTYKKVVSNIQAILNSPQYTSSLKDIWGMVVVSAQTGSLVKILQHHSDIGLKNVQMKVVRSCQGTGFDINEENLEYIKGRYKELFDYFIERANNNDFRHLKMILNDNDTFGKIIRRLLLRYRVENRCMAGKNKVSITANGDLYPCDSFVGYEDFKIGNIFEGINMEKRRLLQYVNVYKVEKCKNCWGRYLCGGDCYNDAFINNGDVLAVNEVFCKLNLYLIQLGIMLVYHLNEVQPKAVDKITKQLQFRLAALED